MLCSMKRANALLAAFTSLVFDVRVSVSLSVCKFDAPYLTFVIGLPQANKLFDRMSSFGPV
jgi:hypothetical protein